MRYGMRRRYPFHRLRGEVVVRTKTYQIWIDMRKRCNKPARADYKNYGARGIMVCERWNQSFANFLLDMGEAPPESSIERIDNNGNYEPSNCRWATRKEQQRNTRRTQFYELNGETLCVRAWEEKLGLSQGALWHRLRRGWDSQKALSTPKVQT
jgi:hypothetical protein